MVVKARTVYTKELVLKFNRFNNFKSSLNTGIWIFIELAILAYIAYLFFDAIVWGYLEDLGIDLVVPLILLFMLPFMVFVLPALLVRFMNIKHSFDTVGTYEFTDNEVIVDAITQKATSQTRIMTAQFETVYDTRDTFYLYITKREAFVIRKADIFEGSVSDLENILRRNIPAKKYIVKNF